MDGLLDRRNDAVMGLPIEGSTRPLDAATLAARREDLGVRRARAALLVVTLREEARLLREHLDVSDRLDVDQPAGSLHDIEWVDSRAMRATAELEAIDEAMWRIELGDYGMCQTCGAGIPDERLEARPHARACVPCALGSAR